MNKIASLNTSLNRLLLANIGQYAQIQSLIDDFVDNPTAEGAVAIDEHFNKVAGGFESVRNAINNLATEIISDDEDQSVEVIFDKRGMRL
jgi:hypothetical protein